MWTERKMPKSHADVQDLPEGYCMTELGPLPEEWRVAKLGDVGRIVTGKTPPTSQPEYWGGPIPFITPPDLDGREIRQTERTITKEGLAQAKAVPQGAVLVSCIGYIGKTGIVGATVAATNQQINAIIVDETKVDHWFLAYALELEEVQQIMDKLTRKTTVPILNKSNFSKVWLRLPPLPEQRAIAHVLRTVQRAKEATEQVIAALRDLKKSLMRHLFTYGPVPVDAADQVALQDTPIGPIPAHWRVVRLGEVYTIQQGKALSRKKDKGIRPRPFLRTANVLWGKVDLSVLDRMDFTEEEEQKYALRDGDLLICEGGEIGRTAIWEGQMQGVFYQNHIFRVRASTQETDPRFHMYWMQAAIKLFGLYQGRGNKTTIPNLSKRRLAEFPIPLPPLEEQRKIARILQTVDRKIEAEEARKEALDALFRSLLHHLMTAKVRLPREFMERFEEN